MYDAQESSARNRMSKSIYEVDGDRFQTLEGFYDEISRQLVPDVFSGRNLDAFNDILRGGFGTPEGGLVLRWLNSEASRRNLGFPETIAYIERKLVRCHASNVPSVEEDLLAARRGEGQTLFEILVEIIATHGPDGDEHEDGVELELR